MNAAHLHLMLNHLPLLGVLFGLLLLAAGIAQRNDVLKRAALVTLAVGEVIRLLIIAERDWTGGSLGLTLNPAGSGASVLALQFTDRRVFYYATLVLWLAGLWIWARLDRSMARAAMEAIGEDETAAASVGIHVTRFKIGITVLSAVLTAIGGIAYAQYISYVNPDTLAGIGVSLRIVFAVVLGGMYSLLGPTVGTALTIALVFGHTDVDLIDFNQTYLGAPTRVYGSQNLSATDLYMSILT